MRLRPTEDHQAGDVGWDSWGEEAPSLPHLQAVRDRPLPQTVQCRDKKPGGANAFCCPEGRVWRTHWGSPMATTLKRIEQDALTILGDLPGQRDQVSPETRLNFSHFVSQQIIVQTSREFSFMSLTVETPLLLALKWYELKTAFLS